MYFAFSYGDNYKHTRKSQTVSLDNPVLYAGPIRADNRDNPQPCFQDIILASVCPPKSILVAALSKKAMANRLKL